MNAPARVMLGLDSVDPIQPGERRRVAMIPVRFVAAMLGTLLRAAAD